MATADTHNSPGSRQWIPLALVLYLWDRAERSGEPSTPAQVEVAAPVTGPGTASEVVVADALPGEALFRVTCPACHGSDAKGVPGLGKDMTTSAFIQSQSDAELVEFIKRGRPADDPLNTTGVAMPAKGANVNLSDADILAIVEYIRSLGN